MASDSIFRAAMAHAKRGVRSAKWKGRRKVRIFSGGSCADIVVDGHSDSLRRDVDAVSAVMVSDFTVAGERWLRR
jgi:hypothetical protein